MCRAVASSPGAPEVARGHAVSALFNPSFVPSYVMATRLETVTPATPLRELLPMFAAGPVPIVMDGDAFVGLVTRIDVLGYLRRRAAA